MAFGLTFCFDLLGWLFVEITSDERRRFQLDDERVTGLCRGKERESQSRSVRGQEQKDTHTQSRRTLTLSSYSSGRGFCFLLRLRCAVLLLSTETLFSVEGCLSASHFGSDSARNWVFNRN